MCVIDKPSEVPVTGGVDNLIENVCYQLGELLQTPLHATGRLDVCTSGLIILARSPYSAGIISQQFATRQISKTYTVLISCKYLLPLGLLRHSYYKLKRNSKPVILRSYSKQLLQESSSDWQLASLNIISCIKLEHLSKLRHESNDDIYECKIELLTGRTHQIRLQFAALDAVVVGDTRYIPVRGLVQGEGDESTEYCYGPDPMVLFLYSFLSFLSSLFLFLANRSSLYTVDNSSDTRKVSPESSN